MGKWVTVSKDCIDDAVHRQKQYKRSETVTYTDSQWF